MSLTKNDIKCFKKIFESSNLFKSFIDDGQDVEQVTKELALMVKTKYSLSSWQIDDLYERIHFSRSICYFNNKTMSYYLEIMRFIGYNDLNRIIDEIFDECETDFIKKLLNFDIIQIRLSEVLQAIKIEESRLDKILTYKPEMMHDNFITRMNHLKKLTNKYDKLIEIQLFIKKLNELSIIDDQDT